MNPNNTPQRKVSILGSTGSIGTTALNFIQKNPEVFEVVALSAGDNVELLAAQIQTFQPKIVATKTSEGAQKLKSLLKNSKTEILYGTQGACAVAVHPDATDILSAMVGAAGLLPTIEAAKTGKRLALANKETCVVAGHLLLETVKKHGTTLLPVDSEHSAIFQCLQGNPKKEFIHKIILTASGGPFFLKPEIHFDTVTVEQALKHPNWSMGAKITIDSATLMNKGLELIEARWLFDLPPSQIDVIVHPQSIIHSFVEFIDGSILAQLGVPDMSGPIAFALGFPERFSQVMNFLDFSRHAQFTFFPPDHARYPSINLALSALKASPTHPAVLNAANEVAVEAFLGKQIKFSDIFKINENTLSKHKHTAANTLEDFLAADQFGRVTAQNML